MAATTATDRNLSHQSAEKWSAHAKDYKMPSHSFIAPVWNSILSLANDIHPLSSPSVAFLDDGCGTGSLIAHLIRSRGTELSPDARLLAADFSAGMVDQVNILKAKETDPLWQRVETRVQDAMDLNSIADGELTHVGSCMCIFMVPDPARAIAEAYRVLTPGGAFSWSSFKTIFHQPAMDVLKAKMGLLMDAEALMSPAMRSEEGVSRAMNDAGFVDVKVETGKLILPMPSDQEALWKGMFSGGNPGFEEIFKGWPTEKRDEAAKLVTKELQARGVSELEGETLVVAGKKPT